MSNPFNTSSGVYEALQSHSSPHHHNPLNNSTASIPMENLDYDVPPSPVRGVRGLYDSQFENPRPQSSIADVSDADLSHSRLPSVHNPSYAALPIDRSGYNQSPSPLTKNYYDNSSQASLTDPQSRNSIPQTIMNEKRAMYDNTGRSRRRRWFVLGALALLLIIAAVALGIFFGVVKPHQNKSNGDSDSSSSPNSQGGGNSSPSSPGQKALVVSGGNGSTVTMDDGSTFTYVNNFGGFWYADPHDPFATRAQAQSYTPPLNTSWRWGVDKIYGYGSS